jgi:hypothetical protein
MITAPAVVTGGGTIEWVVTVAISPGRIGNVLIVALDAASLAVFADVTATVDAGAGPQPVVVAFPTEQVALLDVHGDPDHQNTLVVRIRVLFPAVGVSGVTYELRGLQAEPPYPALTAERAETRVTVTAGAPPAGVSAFVAIGTAVIAGLLVGVVIRAAKR